MMPSSLTQLGLVMALNVLRCVDGFVRATAWAGQRTSRTLLRHMLLVRSLLVRSHPASPTTRGVP
jgi:hypothetical protein